MFGFKQFAAERDSLQFAYGKLYGVAGILPGKQQSTGQLHLIVRVPFLHKNQTGYPKWDNPFDGAIVLIGFGENLGK